MTYHVPPPRDTTPPPWPAGPRCPALGHGDVHVWCAHLNAPPHLIAALEPMLSRDELARAERFVFPRDRERFIARRGVRRAILAAYLGAPPVTLQFQTGAFGKPSLDGEQADGALHFNCSHSHELALYAVTRGRAVGVDVEHIRPFTASESLAERFFSRRENAALRALPDEQREAAFFACWSRKEAYIKATGLGLSLELDAFSVSLAPGEPAALLAVNGEAAAAARWSMRELTPAPGYAAALAVEGTGCRITCWRWPPAAGQPVHTLQPG